MFPYGNEQSDTLMNNVNADSTVGELFSVNVAFDGGIPIDDQNVAECYVSTQSKKDVFFSFALGSHTPKHNYQRNGWPHCTDTS
jgi:hypothetical protein